MKDERLLLLRFAFRSTSPPVPVQIEWVRAGRFRLEADAAHPREFHQPDVERACSDPARERSTTDHASIGFKKMRPWPESAKQVLRHLAAARYFLPVELDEGSFPGTEAQYIEYLHHTEWEMALDQLEHLGEQHTDDAFQALFWEELASAADLMKLHERTVAYRARAGAT